MRLEEPYQGDIEDCIDDFMQIIKEPSQAFFTRLRLRLEYWSRIRYMPNDNCVPTSVVPIDPRLSALYTETSSLVPKANLIKWLMGDEQERNVVSVVGLGGLGKTTLVKEVYRDIGGKFDCKAFLSVSQRPDMTALLISIILQIGRQKSSHSCSMKDLIDSLRESLQHKRYLALI